MLNDLRKAISRHLADRKRIAELEMLVSACAAQNSILLKENDELEEEDDGLRAVLTMAKDAIENFMGEWQGVEELHQPDEDHVNFKRVLEAMEALQEGTGVIPWDDEELVMKPLTLEDIVAIRETYGGKRHD